MLNPYCQLAQRLLQPRHAVCPVYFKSLKITILNYQCQANARHGSFSQIFPICSWLNLRLQNPKAMKVNWLYVFFGGCQPKRKLCPWENWRNSRSSELPRNSVGINGHFLLLMYNVVLKLAKTQAIDGWMDGQPANIPTLSQSQKNWSTQSGVTPQDITRYFDLLIHCDLGRLHVNLWIFPFCSLETSTVSALQKKLSQELWFYLQNIFQVGF